MAGPITNDDEEERRRRGIEALISIGTLDPDEVARLRAISLKAPVNSMDLLALAILAAKAFSRGK